MDKHNSTRKLTRFYYFVGLIALGVSSHVQLMAQSYTPMALRPGSSAGSSRLSDFESINPYSGNLNFSLPLLSAGGRGSASSPVKLTIDQRWVVSSWYYWDEPDRPNFYAKDFYDEPEDFTTFDNGYSPGTLYINHINLDKSYCPYGGEGYYLNNDMTTHVIFIGPDGTQYTFRDRATNGQPHATPYCDLNDYSRGTVFDTMDGSSATFVADQPIYDYVYNGSPVYETASGYVFFPDGTQFRVLDGKVALQRDKNGNTVSYEYTEPNGEKIAKITDSLHREITFEYDVQDVAPYGLCDRITYKGFGGAAKTIRISHKNLSDVLRSGYTIQTRGQLFPDVYTVDCDPFNPKHCGSYTENPKKPSAVWLPDGRNYQFRYNSYAELARVELPMGGVIEYDWVNGYAVGSGEINGISGYSSNNLTDQIYRRVSERRVYSDGVNLTNRLILGGTEALGSNKGYVVEDMLGSTNNLLSRTKHYYYGINVPQTTPPESPPYESWLNGREYQTDLFDYNGTTVLRSVSNTWQQASPSWFTGTSDAAPINNPHVVTTTTLLADSNQVSKRTFTYDSKNNVTDTYEYDYGNGAPGAFLRRTHTDYLTTNPVNNIDYTADAIHILNLPTQMWISSDSPGNNKVSLSKFEYDNYISDSTHAPLVDRASISGHDSGYGTAFTSRGNLTKVTSYANAQTQTGAISTYAQFDIAGNSVKAIDANGNAVTIDYSDRFGSPDADARGNTAPAQLNGQQTYAFPTSATNALGNTAFTQVDYYTGSVVDAEDINGNVSTTIYNDVLDRPTQSIAANNRPNFRRQISFFYDDTNRIVTVNSDSKVFNDNLVKAESFYDKMGRTVETRQYEDATNYVATQQQYDALGRAYKSSNPFRPNLGELPQWTTTNFDALGRVTQITTPDNAVATRSYSGTTTTVTDQALRKRSGTTDANGRLLLVSEDPNGLNYQTTYLYDVLGRLRKTTQTEGTTAQNRYFMYNDLGRLIRAKQTEQVANSNLALTDTITGNSGWSVSYSYDNNGNIISTTDANNRTITGTYDTLNRLTFRDYSDTTPDVTFTYDDPNIANAKGQITAISSSVSLTKYTAFDELGRIKSSQQITNGQTYNFPDYTYDLSGALVSQTYPSGRIVTTTTDNVGRLSAVTAQVPNQTAKTYINNLGYNSFGAVEKARLGNGVWESAQFDIKRAQVKQIGLGTSTGDTSLLKLEYDYGTTDNNGSLHQQKISVPGISNQLIQNYTYDNLNRLTSATETANSAVQWKQTFSYDRFGNRRFDAANTTTLIANNGVYNPQIDAATNRFTVAEGYNYDSEGNLTSNPESQLFSYDAENHLTQVQNTSSQTTADYQYDGAGKRVRKIVGDQETVFVYDAFGKLVAEYTVNQPITNDGTKYLTADALGSPRVITDISGSVVSRHDYMPFGEEIYAGIGGRAATQGYLSTSDGVRQQFTGYERDEESGLDYAQARYYSGKHGRFTSVDPLAASASIRSPQTFNRYSYGLNSPYKFTDSLGLTPKCQGPGGGQTYSCDGNDENGAANGGDCNGKDVKCHNTKILKPGEKQTPIGEVTVYASGPESPVEPSPGLDNVSSDISSRPLMGWNTGTGVKPPVVSPPVSVPNPADPGIVALIVRSMAFRAAMIYFALPLVVIMALPATVQAPTTLPTAPTTDDEDDDPPDRGPVFVRKGFGPESLESLRSQAEAAEANGFPYGVSVLLFTRDPRGLDTRSAPVFIVKGAFTVEKTGNRPNHYTLVFPKPLTQGTVDLFNVIFAPK